MRRSRPTETYNRLWAMTAMGQTATRTERLKCADSGASPGIRRSPHFRLLGAVTGRSVDSGKSVRF